MLETRIEELTAAVKALTEMMSVRVTSQPTPEVVKEPKAKKEVAKVVEAAPEEPAEVPNEKQPTTTDTSPPSEPESAPVTYDDVKKATNAFSASQGRDATIEALARFDVKRATELDATQWADYINYLDEVVNNA